MVQRTSFGGLVSTLLVCSVVLGTGCGDDETSTGGSGGSGAAGGTGGTGATGGAGGATGGSGGSGGEAPTVQLTWQVFGLTGGPIDGVEVCVDGSQPANCATTDATGEAVLTVPANTELAIRALKTGLVGSLVPFETAMEDTGFTLFKVTPTELADRAQDFGVTLDPTKGTVALLHAGQAPVGVTGSIAPASGEGPYYLSPTFTALPQATELQQGGGALFFNVDPGTVTMSFSPAQAGCAFVDAAWGTDAASTTTPVEADVLSGPPNILCQ